jgi:pyruvate,water dikinase
MHEAGGRLFVDVTRRLASPASRAGLLDLMGRGDPLVRDALETVLEREDFVPSLPDAPAGGPRAGGASDPVETDPAVVTGLIERSQASLAALRREVRTKSGPELFEFLLEAFEEQRRVLTDPLNFKAIMAGMEATWWLNDKLEKWLGEKNAADTLTLSAPGNVTSEMGLALLDVADVIRPHPEVVAFLEGAGDDGFLDGLVRLPGGTEARDAIEAYLDRYGMRCVGEIDITRPRWSERPGTLVPVILDHVRNFEPGAARRRFEQGRQQARKKEQDVLSRLRALPDGERKADETKGMIDRVRTFIGYREYPKYDIISRYFVTSRPCSRRPSVWWRRACSPSRRTSPTSPSRSSATSCARSRSTTGSSGSARTRSARTRRSHRPGSSPRTGRRSPGRTGATTCRPAPWSACRSPPGPSREGPASSSTWRTPISKRATSWSPPSPTPAGHRCSSASRAW